MEIIPLITKFFKSIIDTLLALRRWLIYRKKPSQFLSPDQYYAEHLDPTSTIHHLASCIGRDDDLSEVLEAVDSGNCRAMNISASPGSGVSKFILEFSRVLQGEGSGPLWYLRRKMSGDIWTVYFARKGCDHLLDHISDLRKGNIVVVFDDPSDDLNQVASLLAHALQSRDEGKILVITAIRRALSKDLQKAFLETTPGSVFHFDLEKLSRNDVSEVIEELLPTVHPQARTRILNRTQDSVFLTVLVCQSINQDIELLDHVTDPNFIFRACTQPMRESIINCGIPEWQCNRIFAVVAALSPLDISSNSALNTIGELAEVDTGTIQRLLDSAIQAGLFEKYASTMIRPIPDLFGTLLIEQACIEDDGLTNAFGRNLITTLLQSHPHEVIENAANVGWTRGNPLQLVGNFIRGLRENIGTRDPTEESESLRLVQRFAPVDSVEVMDYVELLVSFYQQQVLPNDDLAQEWKYVFSEISPLLIYFAELPQTQRKALEIARILFVEDAIKTGYSNRTATDCLEKIVGFSPLKSIELNRLALEQIKTWPNLDEKSTNAALTALRGLIRPTLEWDDSDGFTFTWSKQLLRTSDVSMAISFDPFSDNKIDPPQSEVILFA